LRDAQRLLCCRQPQFLNPEHRFRDPEIPFRDPETSSRAPEMWLPNPELSLQLSENASGYSETPLRVAKAQFLNHLEIRVAGKAKDIHASKQQETA
jgi:hypothetical protein